MDPLRSTDPDDYQRISAPVAAMTKRFAPGFHIEPHRHERAQLLYGAMGVMRVVTPQGSWVVPPLRAVWVPAGIEHEVFLNGTVEMRTLYVRPDAHPALPVHCAVMEVSPLLRELITALCREPVEYAPDSRAGRIATLILDELRILELVPLHLPMPQDRRLQALCRSLIAEPGSTLTLEAWAEKVGASSRTLARLFERETGLGFTTWRQQARLVEALTRLGSGEPIARVAGALGYAHVSAFAAMFRRALGMSPGRYFASRAAE